MEQLSGFCESLIGNLNSLNVSSGNALFRLILSLALGSMVGFERKSRGQIAGLRTFALISMGACLAMLLSIYVPQEYFGLKNGDPGRIAAQVITGIGFLGGGAMIQGRGSVRGLTTAAGVWVTSIIGLACGVGMYLGAVAATLLCLVVLRGFDWYENIRRFGQETKVIGLKANGIVTDIEPYREVLRKAGVHLSTFLVDYDYENQITDLNFVVLIHSHSDLLPLLDALHNVNSTRSITLTNQVEI